MKTKTLQLAILLLVLAGCASQVSAQTVLSDGVPVNGNVAAGADDLYVISVPADATSMDIDVTWAGGDVADVLVKLGGTPQYGGPWVFDYAIGNADATGEHMTIHRDTGLDVSMPPLQAGDWEILVHGFDGGDYTIVADFSTTEDDQTLEKGVGLNGSISNADSGYYNGLAGTYDFDENDYYTFEIPSNATQVTFDLTGLSADLNLYARQGDAPVVGTSTWDAASQNTGTGSESITVNSPTGGTWFVCIDGASNAESGYTLTADYDVPTLADGVAVNDNVPAGEDHLYKVVVPSGATKLDLDCTFSGGDVIDMLVSYEAVPDYGTLTFDYAIGNSSSTREFMTIHRDTGLGVGMPPLQAGTWYVLIHGFDGGSYSLVADHSTTEGDQTLAKGLGLNGEITNADQGFYGDLAGGYLFDDNDYYTFTIPSNAAQVTFDLTGLSGNLDLYVRQGTAPVIGTGTWDAASQNSGTSSESITITNPGASLWYVAIDGASDAESPYTITADYGISTLTDGVTVNANVPAGEDHIYKIDVPAGATSLDFDCTFSGGDIIDMLVSYESIPVYGSPFEFDYAIGNASSTREFMTIHRDTGLGVGMPPLQAGTWYVLVHGFVGGDYAIVADHSETENGDAELSNGVAHNDAIANADSGWYDGLAGTYNFDENDYYKITVPSGAAQVTFELTGLAADLNLYARLGDVPVLNGGNFDWSSANGGATDETINLSMPTSGVYWLLVDGASNAESAYTLTATHIAATASTTDVLLQGAVGQDVTITGSGFNATTSVDMGPDVTVNFFQIINDTELLVNVDVADLASAGDRTFTVNTTAGPIMGIIKVEFPTNILPVVTNAEPSRSPAIGGVNVFLTNGAFFKSETDIATRGRMMGISMSRVYRSDIGLNGPLGQGWTGYYFQRAIYDSSSQDITWFTPDGRGEVFAWNGTDWDSPAGVYVEADRDSGTGVITLTDRHQFVCTFDSEGRLTACTDRNGNSATCTYNADGQLEQITDDRGHFGKLSYFDHGRVEKYEDFVWDDSEPRVIEYVYDSEGNLVECKMQETDRYNDANGNRTTYGYAYDSEHRLTECTNPREFESGGSSYMLNTYDALGRVIEQRLGEPGQNFYLRYTDDGMGNDLVREFDRRELLTNYTIDTEGRTTQVERKTGFWEPDLTAPIDHDAPPTSLSPKLRSGDPGEFITTFSYNSNHEVTETVLPRGNSIEYTYDTSANHLANGNVLEVRRKDNALGSLADIVSTYTYESQFQFVKTVTNPRGFTTTNFYDYEESVGSAGNLVRVEYHDVTLGQPLQEIETSTTYNAFGQPVTMTDGEGNVTTYEYYASGDNEGFLHKRIVATGELDLTTEFEYDRVGNTIGVWSPRAFEVGATKDNFKTISTVNELNQTARIQGKVLFIGGTERTDTYFLYDLNGNQTNRFREYVTFDGNQPAAPSDPNNPASFTKSANAMAATWVESSATYNLLNYTVTSEEDAIAGATITRYTTAYEYDDSYNRTATVTPLGFRHETVFDERNLTFQSIRAAGSAAEGNHESDYDLNGNVSESRDALSNATTHFYDGFDRRVRVTDAAGHYRTNIFDPNSNVITSSSFDVGDNLLAESTRFYDEIDRLFKTEVLAEKVDGTDIGDGLQVTMRVSDKNSRLVTTTDDNSVVTAYEYDGANRATKITDNLGNFQAPTYNLDSVITETEFHEINGVTGFDEISHTERVLDVLNRTLKFRDRRYDAGVFDTETSREFDGWSRVVVATDAGGTATDYQYDLLSRQTRTTRRPTPSGTDFTVTERLYDDDSRLVTERISKDPNVNTQWQETNYVYDERDRMTSRQSPDLDVWSYTYDAQSNLTERTDPLNTVVTNSFDVRNLLTSRSIQRGTGIVGATSESYQYDGLRRLTSCSNSDGATLISSCSYGYNTLSLVETYDQTTVSSQGNTLATHTTSAEYDATGFRTASVYWDGRRVEHSRDGLNRLLESVEDSTGDSIAAYAYAGPTRIVQRTYGNGTTTNYEYESSGCGCGGSTGFVNRVEHSRTLSGEVLFAVDRRYDVNGNLAVERFDHEGDLGVVYRRDDTYRLTDTFYGVDLTGAALDTQADPVNTPSAFSLHRNYELDPRSNRDGDTALSDTDDSGNSVYDYDYDLSTDDMDLYTSVDGDAYTYDDIEQRTFDAATGLYYAYDYRGYLWLVDTDSDLATPEQVYHHDCAGNRILEEGWYDNPGAVNQHKTVLVNDIRSGYGCGSGISEPKAGEIRYDSTDTEESSVQYVYGKGKGSIVHELATNGSTTIHRFRHEDQAGSLIGVTDEDGLRTDEYFYLDFGTPVHRPILFDGNTDRISSVQADTPSSGFTRVNLTGVTLALDEFNGKQARVIGSLHIGEVDDTGTTFVDLTDPHGDLYTHLNAGAGFVVMDFESLEVDIETSGLWQNITYNSLPNETVFEDVEASFESSVSVGDQLQPDIGIPDVWLEIIEVRSDTELVVVGDASGTSAPFIPYEVRPAIWSYDGVADESTYTNNNANFPDYIEGWLFTPDVTEPCYLRIIDVDAISGDWIKVKGDARGLSDPDDPWRIHAPPSAANTTGALHTDLTESGSRYLCGEMRYMPPQVGFDISGTIYGPQTGLQLSGSYARGYTHDPSIGRNWQHMFPNVIGREGGPSGLPHPISVYDDVIPGEVGRVPASDEPNPDYPWWRVCDEWHDTFRYTIHLVLERQVAWNEIEVPIGETEGYAEYFESIHQAAMTEWLGTIDKESWTQGHIKNNYSFQKSLVSAATAMFKRQRDDSGVSWASVCDPDTCYDGRICVVQYGLVGYKVRDLKTDVEHESTERGGSVFKDGKFVTKYTFHYTLYAYLEVDVAISVACKCIEPWKQINKE